MTNENKLKVVALIVREEFIYAGLTKEEKFQVLEIVKKQLEEQK